MKVRIVGAVLVAAFAVMACSGQNGTSRTAGDGSPARQPTPGSERFPADILAVPAADDELAGDELEEEPAGESADTMGRPAEARGRADPANAPSRPGDRGRRDQAPVKREGTRALVSEPAVLEDCRERFVIAPGDAEAVRERVPPQFELRTNAFGDPLLYVSAIRCERYTAMGTTRATTVAAFGASIESPDGAACASRWPVVGDLSPGLIGSCSNYLFFTAYDNPAVVAWARAGTPDVPTFHVEDLAFVQEDLDLARLGAPFRFSAGSTPSPYELDLVVRERPLAFPLLASFWFTGSAGTVRFRFETDDLAFGEASGNLRVESSSEMARLFGSNEPSAAPGFPLLAGNRWSHAVLTKTVFPAQEPG